MFNSVEALSQKKEIRADHRASTTRMLGQITTALEGSPNRDQLALLKLTLNEKLDTLNRLDSKILNVTADEDLDDEIQQSDEYKERIYIALTRVDKVLNDTTVHTAPTPPTIAPNRSTKIKLPKLTLPHFSGNLMKWPPFWDSHESAIHNNRELNDVDKFNRFRSLLEHSVYDAIAGLTLTTANYKEAIEILHKCFGNKQMIIAKHKETLLSVEALSSDHQLKDL